jgi:glyoxylase-like metal-dependent hydrolase (beta-lactamase superfamily II)
VGATVASVTGSLTASRLRGAARAEGTPRAGWHTDAVSDAPSWTEPGAHPVADGVHRIPLPLPMDGLRAVNVYTLETEEGLTLVDGGWALAESRAVLESSLASIGHRVADITRILVTHAHRDHYTQAVAVRREVGAHVSLGIGERASLAMIRQRSGRFDPFATRLRLTGGEDLARSWAAAGDHRGPDPADWEAPDTWLDGDQRLTVGSRTMDVVATPGHTQGHVVFADRAAGLLFAGDHVLPTITPSIGFEPVAAEQPLGDFLTSLATVRAMPDLRLLPAHGAVTASSHARVDELVAHHDRRLGLCLEAVRSGARTSYDVAGRLPWTRHERTLAELGVFDTALAAMETMAHLDLLAARARWPVPRATASGPTRRCEPDPVASRGPGPAGWPCR